MRRFRGSRRGGVYTKRGVHSNEDVTAIAKIKRLKRTPRLSKYNRKAVDDHLGLKFDIKFANNYFLTESSGTPAGFVAFEWTTPEIIWLLYQNALAHQARQTQTGTSNGYYQQTNFGSGVEAGQYWGYQHQCLNIHSVSRTISITNTQTAPIYVRFTEWSAKRDIPINLCNNPEGLNLDHPILAMYENIQNPTIKPLAATGDWGGPQNVRWSEGLMPNQHGLAPFTDDNPVYQYRLQPMWSYKPIQYYFNFRVMKEIKVAPGATTVFTHSYTPPMKVCWNLFLPYGNVVQYNGITETNLQGIGIWKGLNDKGIMWEMCGLEGSNSDQHGYLPAQCNAKYVHHYHYTLTPPRLEERTITYYSTDAENDFQTGPNAIIPNKYTGTRQTVVQA